MLVLGITILLVMVSIVAFPCWSYSARWGYVPSTVAGALLFCVVLVVSSKYAPKALEPSLAMTTTSQPAAAVPAVAHLSPKYSAPERAFP